MQPAIVAALLAVVLLTTCNLRGAVGQKLSNAPFAAAAAPTAAAPSPAALLAPLDPRCASFAHSRYIRATTTQELINALLNAEAGDLIEMAPNTIFQPTVVDSSAPGARWNVTLEDKSGTADAPIIVCGAQSAVIDGSAFWTVDTNTFGNVHGFQLHNSSYIWLVGFSIRQPGLTGVEAWWADHCILDGLSISTTMSCGVRFRNDSTYNIVQNCSISDTGHRNPGIGEGVYIGTTPNPNIPESMNDRSDYNQVLTSHIGPKVTAEMVDAKANTQGGIISGNYFDASNLSGVNGAFTCVSIKGGPYTVQDNVCANLPSFGR